ncbi:Uncharacterised protein [Vibrio cholerae]|nr:Uncharacterised protein [Vibrio cholerae]
MLGRLYRFFAVGDIEFLIQITNVGFDGGTCHIQLMGNLLITETGVDEPKHLPFTLREWTSAH